MYYSVRDEKELIYKHMLEKHVRLIPVVTSREPKLTAERIAKEVKDLKEREVLLCGPPAMMKSLVDGLKKHGSKKFIYEEFSMK